MRFCFLVLGFLTNFLRLLRRVLSGLVACVWDFGLGSPELLAKTSARYEEISWGVWREFCKFFGESTLEFAEDLSS